MKFLLLVVLFISAIALTAILWQPTNFTVFAQDSPVATPVPDVPPDQPPVPIPPTLLELIVQLIQEGAAWLVGIVLAGLGIAQKWIVSLVRKLFSNDEKTATKINGGVAEVVAGVTSIATALIAFGVAWLTGYVGSADLLGLLQLAGVTYVSGWTVHKVNKTSSIARALKPL